MSRWWAVGIKENAHLLFHLYTHDGERSRPTATAVGRFMDEHDLELPSTRASVHRMVRHLVDRRPYDGVVLYQFSWW